MGERNETSVLFARHIELLRSSIHNIRMIVEDLGFAIEDKTNYFINLCFSFKQAIAGLERLEATDKAMVARIKEEFELLEDEIRDLVDETAIVSDLACTGLIKRK